MFLLGVVYFAPKVGAVIGPVLDYLLHDTVDRYHLS